MRQQWAHAQLKLEPVEQVMRCQLPARLPLHYCGRQPGPQEQALLPTAACALAVAAAASTAPPGLPAPMQLNGGTPVRKSGST